MEPTQIQNNKKTLFISILIGILFIVMVVYFVIQMRKPASPVPVVTPSVTPSTIPSIVSITPLLTVTGFTGQGVGSGDIVIDKTTEDQFEAVANLTYLVPYKGQYFSIEYSESTANYEVTISQANKTEGDAEFDGFLHTNKIKTRESIPNLVIRYQ